MVTTYDYIFEQYEIDVLKRMNAAPIAPDFRGMMKVAGAPVNNQTQVKKWRGPSLQKVEFPVMRTMWTNSGIIPIETVEFYQFAACDFLAVHVGYSASRDTLYWRDAVRWSDATGKYDSITLTEFMQLYYDFRSALTEYLDNKETR